MNLQKHIQRPALLLTLPALLLALLVTLLAVPSPASAAKVRVVAKVRPAVPAVRVVARTSRTTNRLLFFVDGRPRSVTNSVRWRHGRTGVLRVGSLRPGRHRVTALAIHPRGVVSRGSGAFRVTRRTGRPVRFALGAARRVSEPTRTKSRRVKKPIANTDTVDAGPGSLPAGLLFDGGFDNGFDGWHVQALNYRVSLFDAGFDGAGARFEVHDGDVEPETGSERAEVSGASFEEDQELYVRDTIRVSSETDSDTDWQLIQQLREHDWCCSPGMAVFLGDDRELSVGPGDGDEVFWEGPALQTDRWYDLVYRVKLSQDEDEGFVEVWLDGRQQEMANGASRIYGQTIQRPRNYIKAGIYRSQSSTGTTAVDHDNVIVGTSYDAVTSAG